MIFYGELCGRLTPKDLIVLVLYRLDYVLRTMSCRLCPAALPWPLNGIQQSDANLKDCPSHQATCFSSESHSLMIKCNNLDRKTMSAHQIL